MINVENIDYKLIVICEDGKQINLNPLLHKMSWEENSKELSARLSFSLHNGTLDGKRISDIIKLGCIAVVVAKMEQESREVIRTKLYSWDIQKTNGEEVLNCTGYDDLYVLQKSYDHYFFAAGTSTRSIITDIFKSWSVDVDYQGPDVTHAKTVYKNQSVAEAIYDTLEDAYKQDGVRCIIKADQGNILVVPRGSNAITYHFEETNDANLILASQKLSIADLVTRVQIVGKEDEEGRRPVEAVVDGKTEFGVLQKIYSHHQDDTLEKAISDAQQILNDQGVPQQELHLQSIDIPMIRKGDQIHINACGLNGYYFVTSIQHDCDNRTMSMEIEPYEKEKVIAKTETNMNSTFECGDAVVLNGAVYVDSYGNGKGMSFTQHHGHITIKVDTSRACPYHIDGLGWVYPSTIRKE